MELLVSCSYNEIPQEGKLVIKDKDEKAVPVKVNLVVSDGDDFDITDLSNKVKTITFVGKGRISESLKISSVDLFNEYTLEEVDEIAEVEGVISLLRLPDDYCDMRTLFNLCIKYPFLRVLGGNLLNIEGINIGRYEGGKPLVCKGIYDKFVECNLSDLDNVEVVLKKVKKLSTEGKEESKNKDKKSSSKTKSSSPKAPKVNRKAESLSNLFSGEENDF